MDSRLLYGILIPFIAISMNLHSQNIDSLNRKLLKSPVLIVDTISGDFSFTQNWDYPFPFYADEKTGKLKNGLDESLKVKKKEVEKLYYTANCTTNHQGDHEIRYCNASLRNDSLFLDFADCDAAYHGWLQIIILRDSFQSQWYCDYVYRVPDQNLEFLTIKQTIVINTTELKKDVILRGKVDLTFKEYFSAPGYDSRVDEYYVTGLFETKIQ
jgi:hypothetical protein